MFLLTLKILVEVEIMLSLGKTKMAPKFQKKEDLVNVKAGNYTIIVTDTQCDRTASKIFKIEEGGSLGLSLEVKENPSCYSSKDGTIAISPLGGSGSYTFSWAMKKEKSSKIFPLELIP